MDNDELNDLKYYYTIEDDQVYLNKGVIADAEGKLYSDRKYVGLRLSSELMDSFGGMLCLPDAFFLGRHNYGSKLFAYMVLLTLPKAERYDEAIKWPGFTKCFMLVWALTKLINYGLPFMKAKKMIKGKIFTRKLFGALLDRWGPIPRSRMMSHTKQTMSKLLLSATYRFTSREVHDKIIRDYENKIRRGVRDFVMCCDGFSKVSGFHGNLFEDFAHLELQRGGTFRVQCLNDGDSKIMEKQLKKLECNVFTTLNEANKEHHSKPKSKTFASIDSFSLDNNDLALFQITISENHVVKVRGLKDLNRSLTWMKNNSINIYFVVPPDIFGSFPLQRYLTTKDEDSQKAQGWSNKITQYALELDMRMTKKRSIDEMLEDNETVEASRRKVSTKQYNSSDVTLTDNKCVLSKKNMPKNVGRKRRRK
ncbi:DUF185-domain-containing protein [Gigaspora margarita]|uniref:DUF185-domain-containing protein n=1 Tax=Gigaspora margarita TaxID=4874 RepID=A0A8H3WRD1_GIGMA|nr:DUF185-domain-containing protein [Gigaspora margarita]